VGAFAAPLEGGTLDPTTIPQFVTPLVIPPVMNNDGTANEYQIAVRQFQQQILPGGIWNTLNGRDDSFPATTIWSYGPAEDPTPTIAPADGSQFNYPAFTIETQSNPSNAMANRVKVRWINELVQNPDVCYNDDGTLADLPDAVSANACRFLTHLLPIDQTLHWANPPGLCADGTFRTDCRGFIPERYMGPVPIVTHLHGAHVEGHSDGYPEAWWLPAALNIPAGYATEGTLFDDANGQEPSNSGYADYVYRNDQPATTLWYHDHSLGMTRSNVYAGPAGFWLIRGGDFDLATDTRTDTFSDGILPGPAPVAGEGVLDVNVTDRAKYREIPIVIQDRSFNADGSLFYPDNRAFFEDFRLPREVQTPHIPNSRSDISPIWNPEAFFNVMVVNGVSWPKLEVAQALYRFRFLNGCNSRFLWLKFDNPNVKVWQIGADQGFLPAPLDMNALDLDESGDGTAQILMGLAERADVIVDFRDVTDMTEIELLNLGPDEPFGGGIPQTGCSEGGEPDCFDPADPDTTGKVMKFVVNDDLNGESDTDPSETNQATPPQFLALNHEDSLGATDEYRSLSLNEESSAKVCVTERPNGNIKWLAQVRPGENFEERCEEAGGEPFGPKAALLGTVNDAGTPAASGNALLWTDDSDPNNVPVTFNLENGAEVTVNVTENPTVGDIEEWSIYNFTEDAHPIHLHLVRFEVTRRRPIANDVDAKGVEPWETGFKDTVIAYPGEITIVKAKFDNVGLYVWHCHILEHEDNEMMRPYYVSSAGD